MGPQLQDGQLGFWDLSSQIPICDTMQSLQLEENHGMTKNDNEAALTIDAYIAG